MTTLMAVHKMSRLTVNEAALFYCIIHDGISIDQALKEFGIKTQHVNKRKK